MESCEGIRTQQRATVFIAMISSVVTVDCGEWKFLIRASLMYFGQSTPEANTNLIFETKRQRILVFLPRETWRVCQSTLPRRAPVNSPSQYWEGKSTFCRL